VAKKKQVLVIQDADDAPADEETAPDIDELRAIAEMEGGGDIKWTVFRTSDIGNKKSGYCGTLSTGDVSFQKIAEEWGIGTYRIRGTRSNGQFVKQQTVVISEEPKRATQTLMPAGPANSVQDMIALMDARAEKEGERWLKWAAILGPIFTPVIANLFSGAKGTTLTELTTALANIKQLDGGTKVDQMQEFTKLLELVDRVKGDGDKVAGSTWADIARDGIQQIGPILGSLAASRGIKPLPPASGKAPQTDEEARAAHAEAGNPMLQMLAWFKQQLEALIYQASRNRDPLLYAEVMLDNVPAGADLSQLRGYLAKEDWWQTLTVFAPGVQPYPQWFAECRAELLKGLDEILQAPPAAPAAAVAKPKAKKS
jgi:hypothetical protein